VAFLV